MTSDSDENNSTRLASFQHRLGAELLDSAICLLTLWIGWIIWSAVVWTKGQTPAKQILKIRVYSEINRQPANWNHMAIRQFLLILTLILSAAFLNLISFGIMGSLVIIAWYILEIIWYFTKGQRSLRDQLVKTYVVNEG